MTGNAIFPGVFLCVCVVYEFCVYVLCFRVYICICCVCVVIHYGTDNVFLFPILFLLL